MRALVSGLAAVFAFSAAGCSRSDGTITGIVRFKGEPLKTGYIAFSSETQPGVVAAAVIQSDGSYRIDGCPPGLAKITVQAEPPRGHKTNAASAALPARYRFADKSKLTYTVQPGQQRHDVDLVP